MRRSQASARLSMPWVDRVLDTGMFAPTIARVSDDAVVIDAIFTRHGERGPWAPMAATGIANRIYATDDVVLRVAVGSEESISDARTESIASPAARAAGVMTPSLLAFDDSRTLIDRPYSLWERIHGVTVGVAFPGAT